MVLSFVDFISFLWKEQSNVWVSKSQGDEKGMGWMPGDQEGAADSNMSGEPQKGVMLLEEV